MRTKSVVLAVVLFLSPLAAAAQGLPDEAHDFDFWIGTWQIGPGATDKVKRFGKGIAILETFKSGNGAGYSVNVFDATTKTWTQTWQLNGGNYVQYTGKKEGNRIVLVGKVKNPQNGNEDLMRLSFVNISENFFEQKYERSTDGGATWQLLNTVPFRRISK